MGAALWALVPKSLLQRLQPWGLLTDRFQFGVEVWNWVQGWSSQPQCSDLLWVFQVTVQAGVIIDGMVAINNLTGNSRLSKRSVLGYQRKKFLPHYDHLLWGCSAAICHIVSIDHARVLCCSCNEQGPQDPISGFQVYSKALQFMTILRTNAPSILFIYNLSLHLLLIVRLSLEGKEQPELLTSHIFTWMLQGWWWKVFTCTTHCWDPWEQLTSWDLKDGADLASVLKHDTEQGGPLVCMHKTEILGFNTASLVKPIWYFFWKTSLKLSHCSASGSSWSKETFSEPNQYFLNPKRCA